MDYYGAFRPPGVQASAPTTGERAWIKLAHTLVIVGAIVSPPIGGLVGPLLVDRLAGERSRTVEVGAMEALNFAVTLSIACLAARVVSMVESWSLAPPPDYTLPEIIVLIAGLCYVRKARKAIKADNDFRYPLCWRLISLPKPRRAG